MFDSYIIYYIMHFSQYFSNWDIFDPVNLRLFGCSPPEIYIDLFQHIFSNFYEVLQFFQRLSPPYDLLISSGLRQLTRKRFYCSRNFSLYISSIIGRINTNEDNENMLGYDLYSSALADILSEPSLSMPITVGLYAKWGSGKSFLLKKLKGKLNFIIL